MLANYLLLSFFIISVIGGMTNTSHAQMHRTTPLRIVVLEWDADSAVWNEAAEEVIFYDSAGSIDSTCTTENGVLTAGSPFVVPEGYHVFYGGVERQPRYDCFLSRSHGHPRAHYFVCDERFPPTDTSRLIRRRVAWFNGHMETDYYEITHIDLSKQRIMAIEEFDSLNALPRFVRKYGYREDSLGRLVTSIDSVFGDDQLTIRSEHYYYATNGAIVRIERSLVVGGDTIYNTEDTILRWIDNAEDYGYSDLLSLPGTIKGVPAEYIRNGKRYKYTFDSLGRILSFDGPFDKQEIGSQRYTYFEDGMLRSHLWEYDGITLDGGYERRTGHIRNEQTFDSLGRLALLTSWDKNVYGTKESLWQCRWYDYGDSISAAIYNSLKVGRKRDRLRFDFYEKLDDEH